MQQTIRRACGISLRQTLPKSRIFGADDIHATSCCSDSRACRPGDLFVAVVGVERDGHDYVQEALANGAVAVLAERPLPVGVPTCVVSDTRRALGQVCQSLAGNPGNQLRVIGVTGTNGKTTTGMLIASVLATAGKAPGITGSLGYCDGVETAPAYRTTPAPTELAEWMARMVASGCSHAVVEVSSQALAQRRVAGIEFDAAVLTNVRREHLDYHGSLLNYRKAKGRLFSQLGPHGFAVINADDPASKSFLAKLDHPVLTIGMHSAAELTATVIERHKSEQTFLLTAGNETVPVCTPMIGDHHVYNCLAAAAVGLVSGIDLPTVVRGLEAVDHVPGRLQRIECGQPFGVYVDVAGSPDTLAVALRSVRQVSDGQVICVFGAGRESAGERRAQLGRVVEKGADLGITTSNDPGDVQPLATAHDILDGYDRPGRAQVLPNRARAIELALERAQPGDVVLIAGNGEYETQSIDGCQIWHDDREIARNWLYGVGAKIDYQQNQRRPLKISEHWN